MKTWKKSLLLSATLTVTMFFSGFGCKGLSVQQQSAVKPITLNYWTVYNNVDELKKYAAEYKQFRPQVTVNIRQVRFEEFDQLFTNSLADDVGPDIVSMHVRWLRKNQGRLAPAPASINVPRLIQKNKYTKEQEVVIDTIAMPKEKDIRNEYVKTIHDDVVIDGSIYGLPIAFDSLALFYNQTLLDRAGIPEPPKTWDEFVDAVQKTTRFNATLDIVQSGVALGTSNNIDNFFDIVSLFMLQSGVKIIDNDNITFGVGVDRALDRTHPTIRALDFYTGFARATADRYSWNERMQNAFDEFVRGKSAFFLGFAYDYPRIKERSPQLDMRIATIPQLNPSSPSNVANYWVESVVKKSKFQNEAWDFVRFITAKDKVKTYTAATFRPSPYREQITEQQKDETMGPFATQALFAENWYRGKESGIAVSTLKEMIIEFLRAGNTEAETLKKDKTIIMNTAAKIQQTY